MGQRCVTTLLLANDVVILMLIIQFKDEDEFGAWSTSACKEVERNGNERVCSCTQLAHFGMLFVNGLLCVQDIGIGYLHHDCRT